MIVPFVSTFYKLLLTKYELKTVKYYQPQIKNLHFLRLVYYWSSIDMPFLQVINKVTQKQKKLTILKKYESVGPMCLATHLSLTMVS